MQTSPGKGLPGMFLEYLHWRAFVTRAFATPYWRALATRAYKTNNKPFYSCQKNTNFIIQPEYTLSHL